MHTLIKVHDEHPILAVAFPDGVARPAVELAEGASLECIPAEDPRVDRVVTGWPAITGLVPCTRGFFLLPDGDPCLVFNAEDPSPGDGCRAAD